MPRRDVYQQAPQLARAHRFEVLADFLDVPALDERDARLDDMPSLPHKLVQASAGLALGLLGLDRLEQQLRRELSHCSTRSSRSCTPALPSMLLMLASSASLRFASLTTVSTVVVASLLT